MNTEEARAQRLQRLYLKAHQRWINAAPGVKSRVISLKYALRIALVKSGELRHEKYVGADNGSSVDNCDVARAGRPVAGNKRDAGDRRGARTSPPLPPIIDPEAAAVETTTNSDSSSSNEPPAFKDKHPKIHKTYRGARWFCIKTEPFVRYAAHVFQILTPFLLEAF